jgi:hypothetical protein
MPRHNGFRAGAPPKNFNGFEEAIDGKISIGSNPGVQGTDSGCWAYRKPKTEK